MIRIALAVFILVLSIGSPAHSIPGDGGPHGDCRYNNWFSGYTVSDQLEDLDEQELLGLMMNTYEEFRCMKWGFTVDFAYANTPFEVQMLRRFAREAAELDVAPVVFCYEGPGTAYAAMHATMDPLSVMSYRRYVIFQTWAKVYAAKHSCRVSY